MTNWKLFFQIKLNNKIVNITPIRKSQKNINKNFITKVLQENAFQMKNR